MLASFLVNAGLLCCCIVHAWMKQRLDRAELLAKMHLEEVVAARNLAQTQVLMAVEEINRWMSLAHKAEAERDEAVRMAQHWQHLALARRQAAARVVVLEERTN